MKKLLPLLALLPFFAHAQRFSKDEIKRFESKAAQVNIIRDNYGVPHIYGRTDADVVFGLMYTQCEDNFKAIERNYLYQMGRQAEVDGKSRVFEDLQMQLIADTADAIKDYGKATIWMRDLLNAFADGVNYYLYKHPEVKPLVLKRFEPWFPLMYTDGSVAATDFGGATVSETAAFYGKEEKVGLTRSRPSDDITALLNEREIGSNGFAIAPSRSASGKAMLYINPHVPFYFRTEAQLVSDEGTNTYGAITWGQFFVYQGFNNFCGWMHTSSYADVADLYVEKVSQQNGKWFYEYKGKKRPMKQRTILIRYLENGKLLEREFEGYYTQHGPIIALRNGQWLSLKANNRSDEALAESWLITRAQSFSDFKGAMGIRANTSNNTVYADADGNIAFWYGNFMPKRNPAYDWTQPVDGTIKDTEWDDLHSLDEIIHVYNPSTGFIQNCNATPFTCSGTASPKKANYPEYMGPDGENFRGALAEKIFSGTVKLTMDELVARSYTRYLAAFDVLLPPLFKAYQAAPDSVKQPFTDAVKTLQQWDKYAAVNSVATTLAVEWGTLVMKDLPRPASVAAGTFQTQRVEQLMQTMPPKQLLAYLQQATDNLKTRFGTWEVKWGDINRYQRPADGVFDDQKPSLPVAYTASTFGQLPSFVSRTQPNTQKRYGYSGNSFVAVVEFGKKIKARSIVTGGQSSDPSSPHFTDQAQGYLDGKFKDVWFYKDDVLQHAEKKYRPGQ
ncbi:penicillin acylase family protein [Mucilaginibacter sp. RS28]|uniref:Penicillin acylase family protein n=1 Tax=Mucilaginibacter straminoryzae TaxID=2932774 RepID=A0A9X2B821_9SPHI|nr:penicillin acylase family protein [Mucilaginibacter straminoryzae]MCJ8209174.1 penicillin acylase family protein [Mucilaginibacter straminoryzae]